jgi:hypothetical protein
VPVKAAAMFLIAGRSGLRGGRELEEGGPNVAVGCNNVVFAWPIRDRSFDRFDEEEEWDEEEENGGVIGKMGEEKNGENREEGGQELPGADFGAAGHPGLV